MEMLCDALALVVVVGNAHPGKPEGKCRRDYTNRKAIILSERSESKDHVTLRRTSFAQGDRFAIKGEKWLDAIRSRDEYLQASTAGDSVFVVNPTWSKNKPRSHGGKVIRMIPTVTSGLDKLLSIQLRLVDRIRLIACPDI